MAPNLWKLNENYESLFIRKHIIRVLSLLILYVNMKKYHLTSFLFLFQKYWATKTRMRKVPIVRKVPNYWMTTTKRNTSLKKVCIKINILKWLTSLIMHYKRKHMQFNYFDSCCGKSLLTEPNEVRKKNDLLKIVMHLPDQKSHLLFLIQDVLCLQNIKSTISESIVSNCS